MLAADSQGASQLEDIPDVWQMFVPEDMQAVAQHQEAVINDALAGAEHLPSSKSNGGTKVFVSQAAEGLCLRLCVLLWQKLIKYR